MRTPRNRTGVVGMRLVSSAFRGRRSIQAAPSAKPAPRTSAATVTQSSRGSRSAGMAQGRLVDRGFLPPYRPASKEYRRFRAQGSICLKIQVKSMKVRNSLKSLIKRHRNNKLVRRKGRTYVINKTNPRFKARQG